MVFVTRQSVHLSLTHQQRIALFCILIYSLNINSNWWPIALVCNFNMFCFYYEHFVWFIIHQTICHTASKCSHTARTHSTNSTNTNFNGIFGLQKCTDIEGHYKICATKQYSLFSLTLTHYLLNWMVPFMTLA